MRIPTVPTELIPAAEAAAAAGSLLLETFFSTEGLENWTKRYGEDESPADIRSAETISKILAARNPAAGLLFEEQAFSVGLEKPEVWVVDSLAGSTNFVRGLPLFAISIGLVRNRVPHAGLVAAPLTGDWFWAVKGLGAFHRNEVHDFERRLRPGAPRPLRESLVAVGAGRAPTLRRLGGELMQRIYPRVKTLRRLGTVLELCYVAAGSLAAYVHNGMPPWDIAPVITIIEESGGSVTGFDGSPIDPLAGGPVLASCSSEIHEEVRRLIGSSSEENGPSLKEASPGRRT